MKHIFIFLVMALLINTAFSQKLQWAKDLSANIIDHIDKDRNIYIASESYGTTDIDLGQEVVNMTDGYFVKYDSAFSLKWYKASPAFDYSLVNTNKDGDVYVLTNSGQNYYLSVYSSDGNPLFSKKIFNCTNFIGSNLSIWGFDIDTASNIWLTGCIFNGKITFGNGTTDSVPEAKSLLFLA